MAHSLGGKVETAPVREYGKTNVNLDNSSRLFEGIEKAETCLDESYRLYCKSTRRI